MNENDLKRGPNGKIPLICRVRMVIRFVSGGNPIDIALVFGVSHTEMFNSIHYVTDAINFNIFLL